MLKNLAGRDRSRYLTAAVNVGRWYQACQNTKANPWGGVHDSADLGRCIYEYSPSSGRCRGHGVWAQSLSIMGMAALAEQTGDAGFAASSHLATGYLKSLQFLDVRRPAGIGGFREHSPQHGESYPRDAATGAFALADLARRGDTDARERAEMFAKWWREYGTDKTGWPYITFDLEKGFGHNKSMTAGPEGTADEEYVPGDWQAGAGLFHHQFAELTGDDDYANRGLRPMIDRLCDIYDENAGKPLVPGFHGEVSISYGNDDFALITLMHAWRRWREDRMLTILQRQIDMVCGLAAEDGSFPSFGGTFVCALTLLEYVKLIEADSLDVDPKPLLDLVHKTAEFGLTLQETTLRDPRAWGGFYGQSDYSVSREWIHHRSSAYAMFFYLQLSRTENDPPVYGLTGFGWK